MSDIDIIDLNKARELRTNTFETVQRSLLHRPLSTESYPIQGKYLKEAGEMMEESDGDYEPKVVGLKIYDDDDREYQPSLVFVNRDEPDDVILIAPMDAELMDAEALNR